MQTLMYMGIYCLGLIVVFALTFIVTAKLVFWVGKKVNND